MGQQSILHAVKSRKKLVSESKPLCETLLDFSLSEISERAEEEETTLDDDEKIIPEKAHFYVYCASPCKGMRTGKLRVRCANCKSGAITVDRDPQSWADVLESERISGHCEEETCSVSSYQILISSLHFQSHRKASAVRVKILTRFNQESTDNYTLLLSRNFSVILMVT